MKGGQKAIKMPLMVLGARIGLLDENSIGSAIPDTRPSLIRPSETKREIRLAARQDFGEWPLEQSLAREPVMPIAKSLDPGLSSQLSLCGPGLGQSQIIEPQIPRNSRLVVAAKEGPSLRDIRPFGEPGSPPLIVLWNWMELRKIESDEACPRLTRLRDTRHVTSTILHQQRPCSSGSRNLWPMTIIPLSPPAASARAARAQSHNPASPPLCRDTVIPVPV